MSMLVACVREAQPGRVAEVRRAVTMQAGTTAQQFSGLGSYEILQGRARSNLYIDWIEWDDPEAFEAAREALAAAIAELERLFLHPARFHTYSPRAVVHLQEREPQAVRAGLICTRRGYEEAYAQQMGDLVCTRWPERPGLISAGVYQDQERPQEFLLRSAWETPRRSAPTEAGSHARGFR